jgi:hypothetical protein
MTADPRARFVLAVFLAAATAASTVTATTLTGGTVLASPVIAGAGPARAASQRSTQPADGRFIRPPCAAASPGSEQCFLAYRPQAAVNQAIAAGVTGRAAGPRGLSAAAIAAAYHLPARRSSHQTVAVSIAFDTPRLAHFLAVYRRHFGLPACTAASGCFRKVNQRGKKSPMPQSGVGSGWDLEATLDVSMISVACPHCHILVVEANDPSDVNLAKTENTAARLGAQVISNSYGSRESGFALAQARSYRHRGHTIVASAGDLGFTAASFPANLATVTSVGGTKLARAANHRGWRERVWNDENGAGGSGCSAYVSKPSWQHDRHCAMRTVADVSAVATSVPIFSSTYGGWVTVAGTSIGAPLVAGIYGLAGNGARTGHRRLYRHASSFFDITTGNNSFFEPAAAACGRDYLCVAKRGYDAPGGLGSPRGTRAF